MLALPTDLDSMKMMRTLCSLTMTLADIVALRVAFCSFIVPVAQIQGHAAPGQPQVPRESRGVLEGV